MAVYWCQKASSLISPGVFFFPIDHFCPTYKTMYFFNVNNRYNMIGKYYYSDILRQNGSAVDAAIATLFCNGIVNCHSMGLGGGFLMIVYDKGTGTSYFLNARETAPLAASQEMFHGNPNFAKRGPLAAGVPGELAGYWAAHQRFGRLPWTKLIEPSLRICADGYNMSQHQQNALETAEEYIRKDETLREIFLDPSDGKMRRAGSRIVHHQLCQTLKAISAEGADVFYRGRIGKMFAADIQELGGIITEQDLANYGLVKSVYCCRTAI